VKGGIRMFINYLQYQATKEEKYFEAFILKAKNLINQELYKMRSEYREDFYQELLMKLYKIMQKELISISSDFILNDRDRLLLEQSSTVLETKSAKRYLDAYFNEINKILINCTSYSSFFLFVGDIKIRKYIKTVCANFRIDYLRKYGKNQNNSTFSLNELNSDGIEYLEIIPNNVEAENTYDLDNIYSVLIRDEKNFLMESFMYKRQSDYAQALGVTQQYISRKYNKIVNKIKAFHIS